MILAYASNFNLYNLKFYISRIYGGDIFCVITVLPVLSMIVSLENASLHYIDKVLRLGIHVSFSLGLAVLYCVVWSVSSMHSRTTPSFCIRSGFWN